MNRDELVKRLEELDPSDDYHSHEPELDAHSYYAAIDRAVKIVSDADGVHPTSTTSTWMRHDNRFS